MSGADAIRPAPRRLGELVRQQQPDLALARHAARTLSAPESPARREARAARAGQLPRLDPRLSGQSADGAAEPAVVAQSRHQRVQPVSVSRRFVRAGVSPRASSSANRCTTSFTAKCWCRTASASPAIARRARNKANFSRARTTGSGPITIKTGPDGALYVADMYRFVLEHPEWISPEMQARLDLRAGDDKGRIYRVVPEGRSAAADSESRRKKARPTRRGHGQRERLAARHRAAIAGRASRSFGKRFPQSIADLDACAAGSFAGSRHARGAGCANFGKPWLSPSPIRILQSGAKRSDKASRSLEKVMPCFLAVAALAMDSDAAVRLQAAFSLGAWSPGAIEPVLRQLAAREDADELLRIAIMSSLRPDSALFRQLNANATIPKTAATSVCAATILLRPRASHRRLRGRREIDGRRAARAASIPDAVHSLSSVAR